MEKRSTEKNSFVGHSNELGEEKGIKAHSSVHELRQFFCGDMCNKVIIISPTARYYLCCFKVAVSKLRLEERNAS